MNINIFMSLHWSVLILLRVSSPNQGFLIQLVCNLLDEGNAAFREGDRTLARGHFSEGVSVARYAQGEGVTVPTALLESLYVNRAAVQHNMVSLFTFS